MSFPKFKAGGMKSAALAVTAVLLCGLAASAASYMRTTLKELTHRASAVVEVEVLDQNYPPMQAGETFPRTHTDLKVLRALKGDLGKQFVLDTPGGINGNIVSYVPDGPEFKHGERAFVFVKEPEAGHYMVQDLGLGKFNIVERNGETFVENPLCPKAIGVGAPKETRKDLESELITKSIPYATFCELIQAYAAGNEPAVDPETLALRLPNAVHAAYAVPPIAATANTLLEIQETHRRVLWFALFVAIVAVCAGFIVYRRRRAAAQTVNARSVALILGTALACGAAMGGSAAHAFVTFAQRTIWDLDTPLAGKVANQRIIWKQSTAVSKTNANVFTNVQGSFDTWQAVSGARLAFTAGGQTSTTQTSSSDAENVIAWTTTPSNDFSASTLAITFSSFTAGTTSFFRDGDIIFNDRDFNWAPGGSGNTSSVSLHEIGHFVGFQHTTDPTTVMFPFDGGFTVLSGDEIAGAQALYPSGSPTSAPPTSTTTPPSPKTMALPTAVIGGSPTSGAPGTTVNFSSAGSAPGSSASPLASFDWDYGDGTTDTGATVSHTFDAIGTYNVALTVTDAAGLSAVAMLTISIGDNATAGKASFKLNFAKDGADSFTAQILSSKLIGFKDPKGSGKTINGTISIGDQPWQFTLDTSTGKSTNKDGPKISINDKSGTITVQIKAADLQDVLGGHGADNDTVSGVSLNVPVVIWLQTKNVYISTTIPFTYSAKADKNGSGRH